MMYSDCCHRSKPKNWSAVFLPTFCDFFQIYVQEDLKQTQMARNREAKQMQQLERMRQRNPSDRQIIVSYGPMLLFLLLPKIHSCEAEELVYKFYIQDAAVLKLPCRLGLSIN